MDAVGQVGGAARSRATGECCVLGFRAAGFCTLWGRYPGSDRGHRDADGHSDFHPELYTHPEPYAHRNVHVYAHRDAHLHSDLNPNRYTHGHHDSYADTDAHGHANPDAYPSPAHPGWRTAPSACAHPDVSSH